MTYQFGRSKIIRRTLLWSSAWLLASNVSVTHAAFLEMPDTSEVPEYEEGSMLLDLEVPGVRERDPDPEAGPRLNVREFRLQGMVEFPELGITRKGLIQKVEALRFELMQEDKQGETGYTEEELADLADLIGSIEERTQGDHVDDVDVQQLVFLIREQRRKRGVTLGMIETVADTITRYYREKGFMLAKAYIPKQHVRDGVVTLTLLLGELGNVKVEGNKSYSDKRIQSVFKNDMGKPVTADNMEERLYLVNDLPGLSVRGYFQPGSQIGDTDLSVNVIEEDAYDANIRIDNEGSELTGEYRAYVDVSLYNPWLIGGQLYMSGLATFEPDNSQYAAIRYSRNIWGPRWRFATGYSQNDFVLGLDQVSDDSEEESVGESEVVDASIKYVLKRSRARNFSIDLVYRQIETLLDSGFDDSAEPDTAQNTRLGLNYDIVDEKRRMLHIGNVSLVNSSYQSGTSEESLANGSKTYISYDYSMLTFWKPPLVKKDKRIVVKSAGQYAGEALGNVSQFSMAGVNRTRAFKVNRFFSDDALYLGVDFIFQMPGVGNASLGGERLNKIFQPYVFFDYGYGTIYSSFEGDEESERNGTFSDVGLGVNINFANSLRGGLSYAVPLQEDDGLESDPFTEKEESDGKFYFNLQYSF
ncbi:MAG: ShlB/FhaC/HecB family hemolysin secretion/activation protein [Agarilytica sp.]